MKQRDQFNKPCVSLMLLVDEIVGNCNLKNFKNVF